MIQCTRTGGSQSQRTHGFQQMALYIVRYGKMRIYGLFDSSGKREYHRGVDVIVRTDRGLEVGRLLSTVSQEEEPQVDGKKLGHVVREMTVEDRHDAARLGAGHSARIETCDRCIAQLGLPMELVDVEVTFGGERVIVYYLAENRVDFRELVKVLAGEFQTRIEMRQIGVRDEAKLLADYGDCGRPVCCNSHLTQMPPVSMRMAKMQKATLDPNKISGRCSRLKCCLRYEFEVYEELQRKLPPVGSSVETPEGTGTVIGQEVLLGRVYVETADAGRLSFSTEEVSRLKEAQPRVKPNGRRNRRRSD